MSPCYLPYLDAFPSIVVPAKKPTKKPAKQALKSTLATLTPSAAPLASSTRSISNTRAYPRTASVTPKASAVNKCRKPSTPPPLGLPKPSQRAKLIKVTRITRIEPPIDCSQCIRFQNKEVKEIKEVKEAILYQALEGYSCCRHYYNETEEEVKARKERRRDKLYARQERDIKRLKGLNLKVPLDLERLNLGPFSLNLINQDNKDFNVKDTLKEQAEDLR